MNLSAIEIKILRECLDDYVSIWNVMKLIYPGIPAANSIPEWIVRDAFNAINNLLRRRLIVAGKLDAKNKEKEFTVIDQSIEETIKHIEERQKEYNSTPLSFGFAYWFQLTEEGEELARGLDLN
jgi:hypothetical protein